ncbi:MAG: HD domain-containing protein, partial [Ruthenibacterium sp.]
PEELNYDDYSKKEVLDMLLIHDMAEAKIGDQVLNLNEPYKELREQNVIMRKLMIKGSYPNIANLTYYYNVWTGYYNGTNTNSKIARDINLIQSVYTFCEYFAKSPEKFTMGDKRKWISEKGKLETDIGYAIFEKLVEKNLDFSRVFDEMI